MQSSAFLQAFMPLLKILAIVGFYMCSIALEHSGIAL
jgi:hypothetical protein